MLHDTSKCLSTKYRFSLFYIADTAITETKIGIKYLT